MAYRVRTESFEGPFDLLLYLVQRQKVDIGSLSISEIADQYLDSIRAMEGLDLDVASDFLVVASTLLEIKAASLLPDAKGPMEEELESFTAGEVQDILLQRLLDYKTYKEAAAALERRFELMGRRVGRSFGPDRELLTLYPDYLEKVELEDLAKLVVDAAHRRSRFLLESEHIAAKPIPVEVYVRSISERIASVRRLRFSELVDERTPAPIVVVTFLAILELYKRNRVDLTQERSFGDILIEAAPSEPAAMQREDATASDETLEGEERS